ncbi:Transposon Ty3-I Gag-Pol polyprotein [Araneus ventricosus]|uniref:Transposon Ty3-I Gag-Pol polyprotein n=1 Tax=Araneus ventricosus TaxID=182803 RepID=A0A4Y2DPX2_ARAVE|nr:Transposon Ty3-I Gag-Pol polyprotein [Araneus ventricosus]
MPMKNDAYIRHGLKKNSTSHNKQNFRSDFPTTERRFKSTATSREDNHEKTARNAFSKKTKSTPERRTSQYYGCGTPGYIQSMCPNCSKANGEAKASVNSVNLLTFEAPTSFSSLIVLKICGVESDSKVAALTTVGDLKVEGKVVPTELIVLPETKGNRTLLGTNFFQSAGIVLDVFNGKWHFCENPQIQYPFYKVPSENENSKSISDSEERSAETSSSVKVPETSSSVNPRSDEADGIIEECESPYASPVVLVPKPNGSMRLRRCVDFRKLNATTIADTYPLPRMDNLLTEVKSTAFMPTIDIKSGYQQVQENEAHQDKTAFICPFGTYKYLRITFGCMHLPRFNA